MDHEAEIARLHAFILQVSQRLFLAAEVLSIRAEKRMTRTRPIECCECETLFIPVTDAYECPLCGEENYPEVDEFDIGEAGA